MNHESVEPRDMNWIDKGVFGIKWSDGHQGVYPVRYLRQHCPCAACVDEWTGERRVQPDAIPLLIMLQDIESVGRYALQFQWSDGHNTGIYTFTNLRRMCQCDICEPHKDKAPKSTSRQLL
ncbi:MAG: DUF971 domain-containing protein [Nitrospirales bacterium]|nr:DUF971 domain-containing protein [Nitrospirales bacterium]